MQTPTSVWRDHAPEFDFPPLRWKARYSRIPNGPVKNRHARSGCKNEGSAAEFVGKCFSEETGAYDLAPEDGPADSTESLKIRNNRAKVALSAPVDWNSAPSARLQ
jgi:hypothetical protein